MVKNAPFFILANPRSGSSLLRIICDSHPNVTVPPECGFMEWWFDKYKGWGIEDSRNDTLLTAFLEDLESSKKFETWSLGTNTIKDEIISKSPESYAELIEVVYKIYGKKRKREIVAWGDKNNYFINRLKKIYSIYPKAKFIHMVRDGRDVATSYKEIELLKTKSSYIPKLPTNIDEIANEWLENNTKVLNFLNGIEKEYFMLVRYEDLILNLEAECKRICSFLNVKFDKAMLNYYKQNRQFGLEPKETIDWKKKTFEKPDDSGIGRYEKFFSEKDISVFNDIARSKLEYFGYMI